MHKKTAGTISSQPKVARERCSDHEGSEDVQSHIRFRGISTMTYRLPERFKYVDEAFLMPKALLDQKVILQVEAVNTTHYAFSVGLGGCDEKTEMTVYVYTRGACLSPYYSGGVVGAYATSNGKFGEGACSTCLSRWRYTGLEQVIEFPVDQQAVHWDCE